MLRMESEGGTKFYHLVREVCVILFIKSPYGSLDTSVVSVISSASMLRMESKGGTKFYHLVGEVCVNLCKVVSP